MAPNDRGLSQSGFGALDGHGPQEAYLADQDLRRVPATFLLAKKVGARLGCRQILLGPVPEHSQRLDTERLIVTHVMASPPEIVRAQIMALLDDRAPEATLCPSEVARTLAAQAADNPFPPNWRDLMPAVHAVVDEMVADDSVRLSWKGKPLMARDGPYRLRRGT